MEYEFVHKPSYTMATVSLSAGEAITAEAGAMVSHTETIDIETGRGRSPSPRSNRAIWTSSTSRTSR